MAVTESIERELKFEAGIDIAFPRLDTVKRVAEARGPDRAQLSATYFDTPGLDLSRARITLRHRTGGSDAGWHLKLPSSEGARREVHSPLTDLASGPPSDLIDHIQVHVRGQELFPIAVIVNQRSTTTLIGKDGAALAEVTDDHVTGLSVRPGLRHETHWREWEAALITGDEKLLDAIRERVLAAGAHDSPSPSKLARTIGPLTDSPARGTSPGHGDAGSDPAGSDPAGSDPAGSEDARFPRGTAGALAVDSLRTHRAAFLAHDPLVRANAPDAIHQMRVAARRMRSVLRAYRPILDRSRTDPVESELKWLAKVLGEARDAEVMHRRLAALIDTQAPGTIATSTRKSLLGTQQEAFDAAFAAVVEALRSDRYFDLLTSLDQLLGAESFNRKARSDAEEIVDKALLRLFRRIRGHVRDAAAAASQQERDPLLHTVRKESKRLRYAAEVASKHHVGRKPLKRIKRARNAAEDVQEILGEHQDGVITRALLDDYSGRAAAISVPANELARLAGYEQALADIAEARFKPAWKKLRKAIRQL
ncbi:CYTH and CHAD domain-containing protein [Hoyosella sp. G463]|uniref:CYTH and CHAD domain-containing protein n=1 Tax=Lolliginicoccus lacisalsi TaxID=2742202 RepID=A0A927JA84_9ACTN|nr:CYTH and CHAD domain-containing protein [Lolliginicoccus lacisalsi]MBD8505556.1 CYTH and CHAD domain-containing protein [Lolliginicoccus lacisalsi]